MITSRIAALFVESPPHGHYFGLDGVDAWDIRRDAMLYTGDDPIVGHPPCTRWCRLAGLVEARWGYKRGEDGGMFAFALDTVRRVGGVLEHPAYSDAWAAFDLPRPPGVGGWVGDDARGYSCHVEQGNYGHVARKATWLYVHGVPREWLPELRWGRAAAALVSWCGNHVKSGECRPRIGKAAAARTPPAFGAELLWLAKLAALARGRDRVP